MSRISAFKNKINRLEGENSNLKIINIGNTKLVLKYRKDLNVLRNIVMDQDIKIFKLEDVATFKSLAAKEKEIIGLKQEGQCKQIIIDGLHYKLDRSDKELKNAYVNVTRMDKLIKDSEDKKIKNRIRKFLGGN
ncbi:hypothetical protein [Clostridium sp. CF012]|uniref:hypothetical protein n=1 Tax=Clostridium sp. CF012 TaxID=2843319 RepID=UPI001C0B4EA5|nr:hypothetical protein [Clostridium sp. CF012]MBU3145743.1 hypothetical protein [Clostridium sp. CF012]